MSILSKVPYRRYLTSLFLLNIQDDVIQDNFERRKLVVPKQPELQEARKEIWAMLKPEEQAFYINRGVGMVNNDANCPEEVRDILIRLGYREVIEQPAFFTEAKRLFDQPDVRAILFAYQIGRISDDETLETLLAATKYSTSNEALQIFKKYFCDMLLMDFLTWKHYINALKYISREEYEIYSLCFNNNYPFDLIRFKLNGRIAAPNKDDQAEFMLNYLYLRSLQAIEFDDDKSSCWINLYLKSYKDFKELKQLSNSQDELMNDIMFQLKRVRIPAKNVRELGEETIKELPAQSIRSLPQDTGGGGGD